MGDRLAELGSAVVVLVTFTEPQNIEQYQQTNELPFSILIDEDRTVYRAYGLGRGSIRRVWGFKAAKRYVEIFRSQGLAGLRRPVEDTLQLGGDFIISPDGTLAWAFWGEGPDDRPSAGELVAATSAHR